MKRNAFNHLVRAAQACFRNCGWALPPVPRWDVTDFDLGDWHRFGLVLVNLAAEPEYCEKNYVCAKKNDHPGSLSSKEKGGHYLSLRKTSSSSMAGLPCETSHCNFIVPINDEPISIKSGQLIELEAGSRVTLNPGVYHEFYPVTDECIIGEVSTANDDLRDNFFVSPDIGRYPGIEEDEPPVVHLVSDK